MVCLESGTMAGHAVEIEQAWAEVTAAARATVDSGVAPGMTAAAGGPTRRLSVGAGVMDVQTARPMRPASVLQIGSITKLCIAMGVLRLVEAGRVGIDEPVAAHVDFAFADPGLSRLITARHLMSHSSGVASDGVNEGRADVTAPTVAAYVASFPKLEMAGRPGEQFRYCSPGWVLLACLIERVTGRPWDEMIRDEVLAPAGVDVDLNGVSAGTDRHVSGHVRDAGRPVPIRPRPYPKGARPSGGGHASVETLLALAEALLPARGRPDRGRPLSDDTLEHMWRPAIATPGQPPGGTCAWGLGWGIYEWGGELVVAQGGEVFGQTTLIMMHPRTRTAIAVGANSSQAVNAVENTARTFLGRIIGVETPAFTGYHMA